MNITKNPVSDTHWQLIVNLSPEDYLNKVEEEIKSLSKKVVMNGFRPGHVPVGITKKQYGNTILLEELNKMLNDLIVKYIKDNELKILFQPLPYHVKDQQVDIYQPGAYDFGFEVGLVPEFKLPELSEKVFELKRVQVTDEMLDKEVDRLRSVYGERSYPEAVGESDILTGEWKELNEQGEIKEEGVQSQSQFSLSLIKDDTSRQLLMNLKKEESTDLNIHTTFGNDEELIIHNILRTDHHSAEHMNPRFRFLLKKITHIDKAAINQELFDKAFGKDQVQSEEAMREKLRSELEKEYEGYSKSRLDRDIIAYLTKETPMDLPVEFIRKWINSNKEENHPDVDDHQMGYYSEEVKWELISDRITQDQKLGVTDQEVLGNAKQEIANYYGGPSVFEGHEDRLTELAAGVAKDKKYADRIRTNLLKTKIAEWLRSQVKTEAKEISYNEFFHHQH